MMAGYSTVLHVSLAKDEDIRRSRGHWNALVEKMRLPSVFLTWEWTVSWMETVAAEYCIMILFVRDEGGELLAILPLAKKRTRVSGLVFPCSVLTWCGSLELHPDHLDLICNAEADTVRILDACFQFLREQRPQASVFHMPFLAADGYLATYLLAGRAPGVVIKHVATLESPNIDIAGGYAHYINGLSKKKRYNIARERKILCEERKAQFVAIESTGALEQAIDTLFDLHARRAQDKGLISTFSGDHIRKFHKALAARMATTGWIRLYRLELGEEVIATLYGFLFHREFAFYQAGFAPVWKTFSPGKVLIARVLEDLASRDVALFDFLGGGDDYKQFWATGSRRMICVLGFSATLLGFANRATQALLRLTHLRKRAMPQPSVRR